MHSLWTKSDQDVNMVIRVRMMPKTSSRDDEVRMGVIEGGGSDEGRRTGCRRMVREKGERKREREDRTMMHHPHHGVVMRGSSRLRIREKY